MSASLNGYKLLLGVSGSISAYKAAEIVRQIKKSGGAVQVLMTPDAARFIPSLTLSTLSGKETLIDIFPAHAEGSWTQHIDLGHWADLYVIAPATAQTIAKLAHGFSDNMLTAAALAARCPILVCPAMDHDMYVHPATQENLNILGRLGYKVMPPAHGELASGLTGMGRLPEPADILSRIVDEFQTSAPPSQNLKGQHILVTAGPTQEALDPVRFLSNHSTGTMGYALAAAARKRDGKVTLISGPTHLPCPEGVTRIDVSSAAEMATAVLDFGKADIVFMAAAVADYTPKASQDRKMKKSGDDLIITLKRTTDILATLGERKQNGQVLVGFALETDDQLENARRKLAQKNLDWIVLNSPNEAGEGFGTTTNRVTLIGPNGREKPLPLMSKQKAAEAILEHIFPAE